MMTDTTPDPVNDVAPTLDTSDWSRERLITALGVFRELYADEAVARRRAVADKIGTELRYEEAERLRRNAERECENLQHFIERQEYGATA